MNRHSLQVDKVIEFACDIYTPLQTHRSHDGFQWIFKIYNLVTELLYPLLGPLVGKWFFWSHRSCRKEINRRFKNVIFYVAVEQVLHIPSLSKSRCVRHVNPTLNPGGSCKGLVETSAMTTSPVLFNEFYFSLPTNIIRKQPFYQKVWL